MEMKPGDVVMLKSGGHPVTVADVHEDTVECLWMGGEGDLFRETLPKAVLEAYEIEDSEDQEEEDQDEDETEDDEADEDDDDHKKSKHKKSKAA